MPCRPLQKYFLASHIHGLKASLSNISQTNNCNHVILTGDFNITAKSQEYNFLAGIDYAQGNDPEFIKELREIYGKAGLNIDSKIELQSSHFKLHGSEPMYTNVSEMSDGAERMFIECLDYCLATKSLIVVDCMVDLMVDDIPNKSSYPNESCPSDHQPLITTLLM